MPGMISDFRFSMDDLTGKGARKSSFVNRKSSPAFADGCGVGVREDWRVGVLACGCITSGLFPCAGTNAPSDISTNEEGTSNFARPAVGDASAAVSGCRPSCMTSMPPRVGCGVPAAAVWSVPASGISGGASPRVIMGAG